MPTFKYQEEVLEIIKKHPGSTLDELHQLGYDGLVPALTSLMLEKRIRTDSKTGLLIVAKIWPVEECASTQ